jgi:pyruvate/2-oxoglutarate dehydrogenase complex dihydrolipoamide acyltransferase (E2) component
VKRKTYDHRVVDGAAVARFLQDIAEALEHPGMLLW